MHTNRHDLDPLAPEFPGYANVRDGAGEAEPIDADPAAADLNRRKFLALAAATGLAGMVGCRRPDLKILPYSAIPDDQQGYLAPGRPTFYATCLPRAGGALPVLVESHDGRPTKIEGNPRHPASQGSTDLFAQAAILDLYSPDRVMSDRYPGVMEKGAPRRWEDFDRLAVSLAEKLKKTGGEGFYVLAEQTPAPALRLLREHIKTAMPKASWHTYEPVDQTEALAGATIAFGKPLVAKYNFSEIDRILALDCDFLSNDPNSVEYSRAFAIRRQAVMPPASIILRINSQKQVLLPPSEPSGHATLGTEVQVQQYMKRRAEIEQRKTGKEHPDTEVILLVEGETPFNEASPIYKACRAAGFTNISLRRSDGMNRLYVVESTYTVTGTMADHRLRLPASQIGGYLLALAKELKVPALANLPDHAATYPEKWVKEVAKDLASNEYRTAIVVGHRQPAWVHVLAHAVNAFLRAYQSLEVWIDARQLYLFPPAIFLRNPPPEVSEKGIRDLTRDMAAGKVSTLVVISGNPVFNAPADANFKSELQKVATKIRLGLFHDQTSEASDWHLPLAHPLESWGDSETSDGTLCCVQPLIAPLNGSRTPGASEVEPPPRGGRTALEVLALLTQFPNPADGKPVTSFFAAQKAGYAAVKKVFADRVTLDKGETADAAFNKYKQLGFLPWEKDKTARNPERVKMNEAEVAKAVAIFTPVPAPSKDALEVTFHPDATLYDGRFAMNPWLQELPDPITKLVWDNAAVISPATAAAFGVGFGDQVKLTVNNVSLEIPVYVLPGQADYSIALAYGQYGKMLIDRVPDGGGTNVYPARKSGGFHTATNCRLEKTGKKADLVVTQEHGVIPEGREIIGEYTFAEYSKLGHGHEPNPPTPFPKREGGEESPSPHGGGVGEGSPEPKIGVAPDGHITEEALRKEFQGGYGNKQQFPAPTKEKQERFPLDLARPELLDSQFQWGMTIDLSACTGCTACLIACQTENNIPVVGKQEVKRNRELHWIRIDRYFSSDGHTADAEPTIVNQPVACVHCEAAPCEQVCPVNAALHSPEGLNLQVYNRCIGTRYCANACPYKVRRFNWFDFNKRGLDELRTPTPLAKGGSSFMKNLAPETLQMQKNPDVTVRMRGVMEKCTYCVQRIERGKYGAKIAAAEVADGRRTIDVDSGFKADGPATAYRKPKDPKAAGYDLDAKGRVIVPDGLIVTACQSACPSRAITFGNVLDPQSAVSKAKKREGEYLLLGELNTKPRTSFLPRVRNVNPEMG